MNRLTEQSWVINLTTIHFLLIRSVLSVSVHVTLYSIAHLVLLPIRVLLTIVSQVIRSRPVVSVLSCFVWVQAVFHTNFIWSWNRWGRPCRMSLCSVEVIVNITSNRGISMCNIFKGICACIFIARYAFDLSSRQWCRLAEISWVVSCALGNVKFSSAASHFFVSCLYYCL